MNKAITSNLQASIRAELLRYEKDLVEFAADLIEIPSENPPGVYYNECALCISNHLAKLGLQVETVNPSGAGPCVFGSFGQGARTLYFSGHYDVVPVQSKNQFEPILQKANLHGRGAADMKGGIAAMAYAIFALANSGFVPNGRVVLVSVPDEETSGPNGTLALIKAGLIQDNAIGMLTMEPTSGVVWNANRGVISLRYTIKGKSAHVGLHFRGINAFEGMLRVSQELLKIKNEVANRETAHSIQPEKARKSILLIGGELKGGHNFNVVPDHVSFTVDRRTNPEENFEIERDRLLQVAQNVQQWGINCEVEVLQEGWSAETEVDGILGQALAESILAVTDEPAKFELCPGVLETRHYVQTGIPAIAYGPGLLSVSHGPSEFVSISKILQCAEIYALTAAKLLSGTGN